MNAIPLTPVPYLVNTQSTATIRYMVKWGKGYPALGPS